MARYPKPRRWYPKNKEKYTGKNPVIIARSSWEVQFFNWLDLHPGIAEYSSEEVVVPYFSPIDDPLTRKPHRYFPDVLCKTTSGETILVEVKPKCQCNPPKMRQRNGQPTKTYIDSLKVYLINEAKFEAARNHCEKRGCKFLILTEENIIKI